MQTYLFYDIETTGLNKSFDQILQFAAIRTDMKLKEIERYELRVKLNPDVVPAPRALITHHIGISDTQSGISEIDAIKQIHRLLNEPGTISLGYNTLGFDDEFLRFSFFRNLLPPYTHQYANQCGRMDIYPMSVMYYLFKNPVLNWPQKNGKTTLKLEEINNANQLFQGRAHDAIVDVEVTLALAARYMKESEMWEHLLSYFNKRTDEERIRNLQNSEALIIDGFFGADQSYQYPVLSLGTHRHYKNQTLWLRLDSADLKKTTPDTIKETTRSINKKLGEPSFVLPYKERFMQHLKSERLELAQENKKWLLSNPELLQKITNYHAEYVYPNLPNTAVEASLYLHGFWSSEEENFCRRFHIVPPKEKASLTEKVKNPRLKSLATRLLGRHYPEVMTDEQKEDFADYLQQVNPADETKTMIDFRGEKKLTPKMALQEITELRKLEGYTEKQTQLLDELEKYLNKWI